jgi:hypothetical protein
MSFEQTLQFVVARNNLKTGNFIMLVELCQRKVVDLRKCDGKIEYGFQTLNLEFGIF